MSRGAKVKSEDNLQEDSSFNSLLNMLFLVSSLGQVAITSNDVAQPVRRSYLYNFLLGRVKCE